MAKKRPGAHGGRSHYYIQGEGFCKSDIKIAGQDMPMMAAGGLEAEESAPDEEREFMFCRMFGDLAKFEPDDEGLIELGRAMQDAESSPVGDAEIPGGMTYLGQFIDHDITLDLTEEFPTAALSVEDITNGRTPGLDLDNVYGLGPDHPDVKVAYEADQIHLTIGQTTGRTIFGPEFDVDLPNDLPREEQDPATNSRPAQIGDPRNDENLAVAQTHLAFLKFHNKVVDTKGVNSLDEAQTITRQHYQSIAFHDFLPLLVDQATYDDVVNNERSFFFPNGLPASGRACMPVEFSVAAYRLGHSMVRNEYEWNRVFNSGGITATLDFIFEFSNVSAHRETPPIFTEPSVPTDWIPRWTSLHDFSDIAGVDNHPQFNRVRKIDSKLALKLDDLPEFKDQGAAHMRSLAARNLLRGKFTGLPTGQAVAHRIGATPLTADEVRIGPHQAVIDAHDFAETTPLWYYILKEAEVKQDGERLGEVGSRILVETFHALVEGSLDSIFAVNDWKPSLPSADPDKFTMADLLVFVDDLNPLG